MVSGTEMKRIRKSAGLTQDELSNLIGPCQSYVSRWERGKLPISAQPEDVQRKIELVCKTLERFASVSPKNLPENDLVIITPIHYGGIISEGDVLILSNKEPQKGSIVLVYEKINHTPERIGRIIELEDEDKDKYRILLPDDLIINLPEKKLYKVIEAVLHNLE